ncbi:MAG: Lrp/AsnC family transcriptional regulator [Deltaproteobacteria bacterium]|nr:Lrp/AsnC family transcriptional regulator [Deltaproteobacteria bacterium]
MLDIDPLDKRILYELDLNARQSIADLSRQLKLNRDRIIYRIKRLQDEGILTGFTTAVNFCKLGVFVYKTYVRLEKNDKRVSEFVKHLSEHPHISWIGETDGKWDLLFSIGARGPADFYATQEKILLEFSDIITNFSVYTVVDALCFRKSFLVGLGTDHFFFGGPAEEVEIDEWDMKILKLLAEDSRFTKAEIASRLKLNPAAVKQRIERLEQDGIIAAYPISIDHSALGMLFFKAQLSLGSCDPHSQQQLIELCKTNPYISMFIRQLGDCMIELELCVENYQQLNEIVSEIRQRFSPFVRAIDTMFIKKQSYKWVPFSLKTKSGRTALAANQ